MDLALQQEHTVKSFVTDRTLLLPRRVSLLLTAIAILLWTFSISQATFNIGYYGLISSLPITFFLAMGLLILAAAILWVSPKKEGKLPFLQLGLLVIALWGTPLLIGAALPFKDIAYEHWASFVNPITQDGPSQGHLYPWFNWYHNWPGYWIFLAANSYVSGFVVPSDFVMTVFPLLFQFVILLPLYLFLRNVMGNERPNYLWAACWVFYLGQWTGQFYLGAAQSPGYFIALSILFLVSRQIRQKKLATAHTALLVILLATLPMVHYTTTAFMLFIIATLFLFKRIKEPYIPIIFCAAALMWMMYFAWWWLENMAGGFSEGVLRIDLLIRRYLGLVQSGTIEQVTSSAAHTAVARIRMVSAIVLFLTGVMGFAVALLRKKLRYDDGTVIVIFLGCAVAVAGAGMALGGETFERWWLLSLPTTAFFAVKLLHSRLTAGVFVAVIIIAIPLQIIAHTGNQAIDYRSPAFIASNQFLQQETTKESYITGATDPWTRIGQSHSVWHEMPIEEPEWQEGRLHHFGNPSFPHFINIGQWDERHYAFARNQPQYIPEFLAKINHDDNYDLIYDNGDQRVYLSESQFQPTVGQGGL